MLEVRLYLLKDLVSLNKPVQSYYIWQCVIKLVELIVNFSIFYFYIVHKFAQVRSVRSMQLNSEIRHPASLEQRFQKIIF